MIWSCMPSTKIKKKPRHECGENGKIIVRKWYLQSFVNMTCWNDAAYIVFLKFAPLDELHKEDKKRMLHNKA